MKKLVPTNKNKVRKTINNITTDKFRGFFIKIYNILNKHSLLLEKFKLFMYNLKMLTEKHIA